MKRSAGVTISAIVTIAGSLLTLCFPAMMIFGLMVAPTRSAMPVARQMLAFSIGIFVLLAAWGLATAIGLLKLSRWARLSIFIFSVLLTVLGCLSALTIAFMPFPPMPNGQVVITTGIRLVIAMFYAAFALLGACWLYFFTRSSVKIQFEGGAGADLKQRGRPTSISVIAIYLSFSAAMMFVLAFLPFPIAFVGTLATGLTAHLIYAVWGGVSLALGLALWRVNRLAIKAAIAYFIFLIVNSLLYALMPGLGNRIDSAMKLWAPSLLQAPHIAISANFIATVTCLSSAICLVPIWLLMKHRKTYLVAAAGAASE